MASDAITVNGNVRSDLEPGLTVRAFVEKHGLPGDGRGVAVAIDGEIVPRGDWGWRQIDAGAKVELVQAIQGG